MLDLADLLKDAAGAPSRPLDMRIVRLRAARLGRGRWRLWLVGLVVLVGAGAPAGSALLPASDRPTRVETGRDGWQLEETEESRDKDRSGLPRPASSSGAEKQLIPSRTVTNAASDATKDRVAYVTVGNRILVTNLDGTDAQDLGAGTAPSWSPDANRITYFHCSSNGVSVGFGECSGEWGVAVMNSDGSEKRVLTEGNHPTWSPDGRSIAFVRDDIYVIRTDGTGEKRLTSTVGTVSSLDWSPDGTQLAFAMHLGGACPPECEGHVYVVGADGSGLRQVTSESGVQQEPAWSPDGTRIAYTAIGAATVNPDSVIYTVRPDGTGLTRLTDNRTAPTGRPQGRDSSPDWTPDGRIVWVQDPGDPGNVDGSDVADMYVMNPDRSGVTRLFPGASPAVAPRRSRA